MKYNYKGNMALFKVFWRKKTKGDYITGFLRRSVFAVLLALAFTPIIHIDNASYTVFLLSGLASWFYLEETIQEAPNMDNQLNVLLKSKGYGIMYSAVFHAISALPILVFWSFLSLGAAVLLGQPLHLFYVLPLYFSLNIICAVAYSSFSFAFMPLFPSAANTGFLITLPILFWSTPIVYPVEILPEGLYNLSYFNPLFYIVQLFRAVTITGVLPGVAHTLMFLLSFNFTLLVALLLMFRVNKAALPIRGR